MKFALSEIKRIDNKLNRFKYKSVKLWEKKNTTDDIEHNALRKRIKEYKNSTNKKNFFLKLESENERFFNKEQLQTIHHTNRIIKEIENIKDDRKLGKDKTKPHTLANFLNEKQEITMKSYLLKIIEKERYKITQKNISMSNSINEIENKLDEDQKLFLKFKEIEKIKQKEMEKVLNDQIKENKNYYDKKKELIQQNKILLDELDRFAKMITNLKEYRSFIHTVLGKEIEEREKQVKKRKSDFEHLRDDKDIEKYAEELM